MRINKKHHNKLINLIIIMLINYVETARSVNGYDEIHYSEILLVVTVSQVSNGTRRESDGIATLKVVRVPVVGVHHRKDGFPCSAQI